MTPITFDGQGRQANQGGQFPAGKQTRALDGAQNGIPVLLGPPSSGQPVSPIAHNGAINLPAGNIALTAPYVFDKTGSCYLGLYSGATAPGVMPTAVYGDQDGIPGPLLQTLDTFAASSSGTLTGTVAMNVTKGRRYWVAIVYQGTGTAQIEGTNSNQYGLAGPTAPFGSGSVYESSAAIAGAWPAVFPFSFASAGPVQTLPEFYFFA